MAEDLDKDQPERAVPEEESSLAPVRHDDWDIVMERAQSVGHPLPVNDRTAPSQQPRNFLKILKASTPVLIILAFVLFRLMDYWDRDLHTRPMVMEEQSSLSGIQPQEEAPDRLSAEGEAVVSKLEALRNQGRWAEIREAVQAEKRPGIIDHPVVKSFGLIARSRGGERSVSLESDLIKMEPQLRSGGSLMEPLLHEIRIAQAEQIIRRSQNREILERNLDKLYRLMGSEVESPYEASVRINLARLYEELGDAMAEKAEGILKVDKVLAGEARKLYQFGLRWVVQEDRWYQLTAITPAAEPLIVRLTEKLANANRLYHGVALPFTGRDSRTWTGEVDSPVHDRQAGN